MTAWSRIAASLVGLRRPQTTDVSVGRDLAAKMPDGVVLLADRWFPARQSGGPPTVLIRTPYGRRTMGPLGRLYAERGYQVVIQSCRGTFGSGGAWEPFRNERRDGHDTLRWLASQPWFGGAVVTFGPSYLGLVQWAICDDAPDFVRAIAPAVTAADFRGSVIYPGGALAFESMLGWVHQVEHQERPPLQVLASMARSRRDLQPAYATLPLSKADHRAVGRTVDFYQDWLGHDSPEDTWWDSIDFRSDRPSAPPATFQAGWYDIFLPAQLEDFMSVRAAGGDARITIGPWTHASPRGMAATVRDSLAWFDEHCHQTPPGDPVPERATRVRAFVMGARRWLDLPDWPPPAELQRWHLHPQGRLDRPVAGDAPPDRYRYDPADPTPGIGGASLDMMGGGRKDQRRREARADVLTFTSAPMTTDLTVVGPLTATVHLRSSVEHADVHVRLCVVSAKGRSTNVSDGIVRLRPGGGRRDDDDVREVQVTMWPAAVAFGAGERIRVQVSSGAHPLYARNTGTGEPLASATTLQVADREVFHDPVHRSAIELPVIRC
jgi:uncharacterized protein